jgi:hypothetical protein
MDLGEPWIISSVSSTLKMKTTSSPKAPVTIYQTTGSRPWRMQWYYFPPWEPQIWYKGTTSTVEGGAHWIRNRSLNLYTKTFGVWHF